MWLTNWEPSIFHFAALFQRNDELKNDKIINFSYHVSRISTHTHTHSFQHVSCFDDELKIMQSGVFTLSLVDMYSTWFYDFMALHHNSNSLVVYSFARTCVPSSRVDNWISITPLFPFIVEAFGSRFGFENRRIISSSLEGLCMSHSGYWSRINWISSFKCIAIGERKVAQSSVKRWNKNQFQLVIHHWIMFFHFSCTLFRRPTTRTRFRHVIQRALQKKKAISKERFTRFFQANADGFSICTLLNSA